MRADRLVPVPLILLALALTLSAPQAQAQASCAVYSPPPVFQPPQMPPVNPSSRVLGVHVWVRNGTEWLLYNLGNELALQSIADPENPGDPQHSNFDVPPFGDRDYNLFGFDICDECRFGFAGFDVMGTVLFDMGEGDPTFADHEYYPDTPGIGGLTFLADGVEYLIAKNLPGGCVDIPTLWRIWGVHDGEREFVECVGTAGETIGIDGGYRLSDATADYLVIADQTRRGYLFRVDPGPTLTYTGTYFNAPTGTGHGLAMDHGLLATAFGDVTLYDIGGAGGLGAPQLIAQWTPDYAHTVSLVALAYPYLWVAVTGGNIYAYDVSDPATPIRVDVEFWSDPELPWNSYAYEQARDAAFTSDGHWMFLARFSVLQRFRITQDCMPYTVIFADNFESADPSAWSLAVP